MCCEAASRFVTCSSVAPRLPSRRFGGAPHGTSVTISKFTVVPVKRNLRFCFQFRCLILASLLPLCRPWICVGESAMHTNEIICCDWGLDVAAAESNLPFLRGEKKGTCVYFSEALVIHSWHTNPSYPFPQTLNLFRTQAPESGVPYDNVPQSDWIWYEDCYMCWKVVFTVASNTTDLFRCRSSEME